MFPFSIPKYQNEKYLDFHIIPNIRRVYKNKFVNLIIKFLFKIKLVF